METQKREERGHPRLSKGGLCLLGLSFLAAAGLQFIHPALLSRHFQHLPGIGLMLTQWTLLGAALILGRDRVRENPKKGQGIFLLLCAALLGACYGLFGNDYLRLMNLPVLMLLSLQALYTLLHIHAAPGLSAAGLWEGARRFLSGCFAHVSLPFRAFSAALHADHRRFAGVGAGAVLSLAAAAAALALLSSADTVFGGMLSGAAEKLDQMDGVLLFRLMLTLLGGLMLFSLLCSAVLVHQPLSAPQRPSWPALPFAMVLSVLAMVYALFVYVQIRYLFGGQETALLAGGYAEYARSGFFQLVLLAFLTLALILPVLSLFPRQRSLRILCGAVAVLTMIIDFSAFFRMRLYIQAYGLSVLRMTTFFGMAVIFAALLLSLARCFLPGFRLSVPLTAFILLSWLVLNYSNVDLQIARYNVNAYNRGALTEIDTDYFLLLSPDVLPALDEIEDAALREKAKNECLQEMERIYPARYDWALCWRRIGK